MSLTADQALDLIIKTASRPDWVVPPGARVHLAKDNEFEDKVEISSDKEAFVLYVVGRGSGYGVSYRSNRHPVVSFGSSSQVGETREGLE